MFDHAVEISEAFRQGASQMQGSLIPALKGCPHCRTVEMIAAPHVRRLRCRDGCAGPDGRLTVYE